MNKKGFTLVELLATITIIVIISTIAVPSAFNIRDKINKDLYCKKVEILLNEANKWGMDHVGSLKSNCYTKKQIKYFVEQGFIKKEKNKSGYLVESPYDKSKMDDRYINLYVKNNVVYSFIDEPDSTLKTYCGLDTTDKLPNKPTTAC